MVEGRAAGRALRCPKDYEKPLTVDIDDDDDDDDEADKASAAAAAAAPRVSNVSTPC